MITGLDILISTPLLWAAFKGFKNGFIKEIFSTAALLLGIYLSYRFSFLVEEKLEGIYAARAISFVVIFFSTLIGVHFIGILVTKIIRLVLPTFLDKLLGIGFGVVKWLLICATLLYMLNTLDPHHKILKEDIRTDSILYSPIEKCSLMISDWFNNENSNY